VELQRRNEQHNYVGPKSLNMLTQNLSISKLINILEKICLTGNILSLYDHFKAKHEQNIKLICVCSFECNASSVFSCHQRQIIDSQGIVSFLNTDESDKVYVTPHSEPLILLSGQINLCIFQCPLTRFEPDGLFRHFQVMHAKKIDIRVQCYIRKTRYTLEEFHDHIGF
jgi:hypothetical protein